MHFNILKKGVCSYKTRTSNNAMSYFINDTPLSPVVLARRKSPRYYTGMQSRDDRERYASAENRAREAKRGLWADPKPVPPWKW